MLTELMELENRNLIKTLAVNKNIKINRIDSIEKKYRELYPKKVKEISIEHLSKSTGREITIKCIECGSIRTIKFRGLFQGKFHGKCKKCVNKNLVGLVFGRLTVIKKLEKKVSGHTTWECRCECGNITKVERTHLTSGHTKSCGCLAIELATIRLQKIKEEKGYKTSNSKVDRFYNKKEWKKLRKEILPAKCIKCNEPATLVHHTYSRYYFKSLELEPTYLVPLCFNCHNIYHNKILKFNCAYLDHFENWIKVGLEKDISGGE